MKAAPLVAAQEEGLEFVEGDEEAHQVAALLGVGEQEMLLTAQRGRQGFSTGPVQFGSQEQTFPHAVCTGPICSPVFWLWEEVHSRNHFFLRL